jgi:hypothetical protein
VRLFLRKSRVGCGRSVSTGSENAVITECRTYGARILFGIDSPALPGWADVWRSALRASHPSRLPVSFLSQVFAGNFAARDDNSYLGGGCECPRKIVIPKKVTYSPNEQEIKPIESISIFGVHFTLNLPQASQLLGMTKGRAMLPCASVGWSRELQIPPLRCASVGMTILLERSVQRSGPCLAITHQEAPWGLVDVNMQMSQLTPRDYARGADVVCFCEADVI